MKMNINKNQLNKFQRDHKINSKSLTSRKIKMLIMKKMMIMNKIGDNH